ncbi:MAG: preprotein translocase subunit SecY [Clostridia bacterium]|nr:preprotein translocase subunit SecY [Clostridia bacterium]
MLQTLRNAWAVLELRKKLLFTVMILVLYRFGAVLPVPFLSADLLTQMVNTYTDGSFFQYFNILTGNAFSKATLFALSVSPYITAQIVIQLLTIAIPALERIAKEDDGRKKLAQFTRVGTIILALVTAYGYTKYIESALIVDSVFIRIVVIACYVAGSALVMWLAEKIDEFGIGNGISMILFCNIVSSLPASVSSLLAAQSAVWAKILVVVIAAVIALACLAFVVYMTNAERRLPVQYAKKVVGRKMFGGQSTTLPLKLNMTGVMPIIFANSIVAIPSTLSVIFPPSEGSFWNSVVNFFSYTSPVYAILFFILIIAFNYFYVGISFNPVEVANNLKKNGGFILGIRPGKPTADYISRVLSKVTLIGALFLAVIAVFPLFVNMIAGNGLGGIAFGGSSLLIIVGVALETYRELEAQMTMRHYKGFLE